MRNASGVFAEFWFSVRVSSVLGGVGFIGGRAVVPGPKPESLNMKFEVFPGSH